MASNGVVCWTLLAIFVRALDAASVNVTTIDQRQTGDYNIHINLKDVKIIALLNGLGSEDYDYNYDYSEITVKPSQANMTVNRTTIAAPPTAVTSTTNVTTSLTTEKIVEITPPNHTTHSSLSNKVNASNIEIPKPIVAPINLEIPVQILSTPVEILKPIKKPVVTAATVTESPNKNRQADCIEGFFKDQDGNCRSKTKKQQTLLRRLIQLAQHRNHHIKQ